MIAVLVNAGFTRKITLSIADFNNHTIVEQISYDKFNKTDVFKIVNTILKYEVDEVIFQGPTGLFRDIENKIIEKNREVKFTWQ